MTTGYQRTIGIPLGFAQTSNSDRDTDFGSGNDTSMASVERSAMQSLDAYAATKSVDPLEMIARALVDIDTKISNIAGQIARSDARNSSDVPERLLPAATLLREASVEQLEALAASGLITLDDAMEIGLIAVRNAGETAEASIVEAGRLRRLLDRNANEIDAGQHRSRLMIEDLLVG